MLKSAASTTAASVGLAMLGALAATGPGAADNEVCVDCFSIRVGTPVVVRGPFPDELDATFTALKLPDGSFRGFSANGTTYAIDGSSLWDMAGPRQPVLQGSEPGGVSDCGRWLTSTMRAGEAVLGLVHQERACDYDAGRTDKSMAIATSRDDGLTWTEAETVISGRDVPLPDQITGEGDCTMVNGLDGYLYAYCLRNSDWQTIVARAPVDAPMEWHKYHDGRWNEPGLGGQASAIGFIGPGAAYLLDQGMVATVATDPWFGGLRLSVSADKVSFIDLDEPLVPIDGAEWSRPADTGLIAYVTMLNPDNGSNAVNNHFLLSYIYVPPNKGFESRYLVHHEVQLSETAQAQTDKVGMALTRWTEVGRAGFVTSIGPMTGDRRHYEVDSIVAYLLTRAPKDTESVKLVECSSDRNGRPDQILSADGSCEVQGYRQERSAGWLYADQQDGTVPLYRCIDEATQTHFASASRDCEGLGKVDVLLGYGLTP